MREICQKTLPVAAWLDPRLTRMPGMLPLDRDDWLRVDDAFAAQMAYRDELIATKRDAVHRIDPAAMPAAEELLDTVLGDLARDARYRVEGAHVTCPDGVRVALDRAAPLITLGRLCQNDFVLMEKRGREHAITGAILCFPASWSLDDKFGRGLIRVHEPVDKYDDRAARGVQRLFDVIRPETPMWRANFLLYADPDLHQPRRETDRRERPRTVETDRLWMRVERQCLLRLPESVAVVFSIHTYVVRFADLTEEQRAGLDIEHAARVAV